LNRSKTRGVIEKGGRVRGVIEKGGRVRGVIEKGGRAKSSISQREEIRREQEGFRKKGVRTRGFRWKSDGRKKQIRAKTGTGDSEGARWAKGVDHHTTGIERLKISHFLLP
jgi:hypothetical protein